MMHILLIWWSSKGECCKLRVMNDHIDGHYELHLLIFKMSNGSSYYEAYKRLLTPHVRASREKKEKFFLSFSLSLSLFLSLSQFSSLIPSSILYIKVRYILSVLFWFALYLSLFYNILTLISINNFFLKIESNHLKKIDWLFFVNK